MDLRTGEFVAVPFDSTASRDNETTTRHIVRALETFFEHFGLELRDVVSTELSRPKPLSNMVEIRGNLTTIDTATPLSEALTKEVENDLYRLAYAGCKTRARATAERIYHEGLYVNTVITLSPCEGAEPFKTLSGNKEGSCIEPVRLPNGDYQFALSRPFAYGNGHFPQEEADMAAWQVSAVLMEYVEPAPEA